MRQVFFLVLLALSTASCSHVPLSITQLHEGHGQVIYVLANGDKAQLSLWEKGKQWARTFHTQAQIGKNSLAGIGEKKEGDGKTPAGVFALYRAFGTLPQIKTGLTYVPVTEEDKWVDDPQSPDYNQWVKQTQAASYEQLKRPDGLYDMAAVIEYNTNPVYPGEGSAIFLHIARPQKATAGCVAIARPALERILSRLSKDKHPLIILEEEHGSRTN